MAETSSETWSRLRWWCLLGSALVGLICYLTVAHLSRQFQPWIPGVARPILTVLVLFWLAFASYLAALWAACGLRESGRLWWAIVLMSVLFRAALIFSQPIQEVDVYRYLWDGVVSRAGVNPFRFSPQQVLDAAPETDLRGDLGKLVRLRESNERLTEILSRVHHRRVPTIYPPVSQAVFAAVTWLTPVEASVPNRVVVMKLCAVGFDLATLWLVMRLLRTAGLSVGWSVAYGWCPLLMKEYANGGHFDALPLFLSTAAVLLAVEALFVNCGSLGRCYRRVRMLLSVFCLVLAIGAKLYPVVLVPLMLGSCARKLGRRFAMLMGLVGAVAVLGLFSPFGWPAESFPPDEITSGVSDTLPPVPDQITPDVPHAPSAGLMTFLQRWEMNDFLFLLIVENVTPPSDSTRGPPAWFALTPIAWRIELLTLLARRLTAPLQTTGFLFTRLVTSFVFLVVSLWAAFQGSRTNEVAGWLRMVFITLAWFWLLSPTQNPWYWTWVLPFLPFAGNPAWLAVSGLVFLYYVRFYCGYHWPEQPVPGFHYPGTLFFDYVVTWIEFGPWLLGLVIVAAYRRFKLARAERPS